jgi:hypothetical protein
MSLEADATNAGPMVDAAQEHDNSGLATLMRIPGHRPKQRSAMGGSYRRPSIFVSGLFRLDPHSVIDRVAKLLLASEVALGGLNGDMPKQELDLIPFATGEVAQPRASAPKIMRSKFLYARPRGGIPDNFPQHLRGHSAAPDSACLVERSK